MAGISMCLRKVILVGSPGSSDQHGEKKVRRRTMIAAAPLGSPANGMGAAGTGWVTVRPSPALGLMNIDNTNRNTLALFAEEFWTPARCSPTPAFARLDPLRSKGGVYKGRVHRKNAA
jgi:hypothetical protein